MNKETELNVYGILTMPRINDMEAAYGKKVYSKIEAMFQSMWKAYLKKGNRQLPNGKYSNAIALPAWAKIIKHPRAMNQALKILSDNGWIVSSSLPNNNWGDAYLLESKLLQYTTQEQLDHLRMYNKFVDYKLEYHNLDQDFGASKIKRNGKVAEDTFACEGFAKTGKVPFRFDTVTMQKNYDLVLSEVNKGIVTMIEKYPAIIEDHANYQEIGKDVVDSLIYEVGTYNPGPRTSDPRRRNNSGYLNKIGNPVGFKVMRGLLVIPEHMRNTCTPAGLINKYLFIAELVGYRSGTVEGKINFGRQCFYNATQAHNEVENLWLNRTYTDIINALGEGYEDIADSEVTLAEGEAKLIQESNYKWQVPIEIDMSASVLGYWGLLLNHKPFLDRCNITYGPLSDAWGHNVITNRDQFKTSMRQCYGSQMSAQDMWNDMEIKYTQDEVDAFNHEMEEGELAVAVAVKDFMIDNAQMQPVMNLNVLGTMNKTSCNKFTNVGETTTVYDLFDTATGTVRTIHNTQTKRVPDLKSFRRYGPTGLIHALDGRVMNNTVDAVVDKYNWVLDIHDAMILCCEAADFGRDIYANGRTEDEPSLKHIHTNRNKILSDYFTSLNIPASKLKDWKSKVVPLIEPLEEELNINPMVLK